MKKKTVRTIAVITSAVAAAGAVVTTICLVIRHRKNAKVIEIYQAPSWDNR